eukprot:1481765-Rhodomonas_salina.2
MRWQEVTQQEEESSSSKEEEVEAEPEAPLELQELSASLPFDPSVYSESKVCCGCTLVFEVGAHADGHPAAGGAE